MKGKVFGDWRVFDFAGLKYEKSCWFCVCKCGVTKVVYGSQLVAGTSKNCGCQRKKTITRFNKLTKTKHGLRHTRFYGIWNGIHHRNSKYYDHVVVCSRWKKFENFRDDMHESYKKHCKKYGRKNTTIDRIDGNSGYYPDNCRWATWSEQRLNQRRHERTYTI